MVIKKSAALSGMIVLQYVLLQFFIFSISNAAEFSKVNEEENCRLLDKEGNVSVEIKSTQTGPVIIVYDQGVPTVIDLDSITSSTPGSGLKIKGNSLEEKGKSLIDQRQYDDAIALLSKPVSQNPMNFNLSVLLLRAEVERSAVLKEKGDKSYKYRLQEIYQKGQKLYKQNRIHPEPFYIVAKSLYLNKRYPKAHETVKKAIYYSPNDPYYLMLKGDICIELMKTAGEGKKHSYDRGYSKKEKFYNEAMDAYQNALIKGDENPGVKSDLKKRITKAEALWKEIDS